MANVYLSPEGFEKLKNELDHLKTVRRRELSGEIGRARELGDISENAEYHAAKEAQGLNEKRIAELEEKLGSAQLIDEANISKDEALIGATVKVKDLNSSEEESYTLVSEIEADFAQGKISVASPVGKALLGHKKDDIVEVDVPAGLLKYKIISISR
ncbi:transcription elongation factor GreA [Candidatus Omnitrophota bacterium]